MQKTFSIIKPDATKRNITGSVISLIENSGLRIVGQKRIHLTINQAKKFLSGNNYTISDIATFPWIARHEWHDIGLSEFKNLKRWYNEISKREAVIKGFSFMNKNEKIPKA